MGKHIQHVVIVIYNVRASIPSLSVL